MTRKQLVTFGILLIAFAFMAYALNLPLDRLLPGIAGSISVFGFALTGTDIVLMIFVAFGVFVLVLTRVRKSLNG